MRLHRFYVEEKIGDEKSVILSGKDLIHQWLKVFRFKVGQKVVLFDNTGTDFFGTIIDFKKGSAEVEIESSLLKPEERYELTLFQAIGKKDKMEWIVEKATELGVSRIVPVVTERTEKQNLNFERLNKIAIEASEQCGRSRLPEISPILDFEDVIHTQGVVALHMIGEQFSVFKNSLHSEAVKVLIGPEGGWSEKELALFKEKGIPLYSIGVHTLRTETAAVAVASLILLS